MEQTFVLKEELGKFTFLSADRTNNKTCIDKLQYGVRLGNEFKGKTTIAINTTEGPIVVETTIWSLIDGYIQLKGGTLIPLNSIMDVHF